MSELKVYDLQMQNDEDAATWSDKRGRAEIITGGIELAKDRGCHLLRILDREGKQVHLEGFGPRLWDLVREAHKQIEQKVVDIRINSKDVHSLLQEAMYAFERGDRAASYALLERAMGKEHELFGDSSICGNEKLLAALEFSGPRS